MNPLEAARRVLIGGKPGADAQRVLIRSTPHVQQTFALARAEASRLNHNFIGAEHLFMGMVKLRKGTAATLMLKRGIDLERATAEVEKFLPKGPARKSTGVMPLTPRFKKILAIGGGVAEALNHPHVGTEHLLLGLLSEADGVAARALKSFNVEVESFRDEILKELSESSVHSGSQKHPIEIKNLAEVPAFATKDGSEIRELLAYRNSAIRHQSLAEARVPVGSSTLEHYHPRTEEIYYITHGSGRIRIEGEVREVKPGDAIAIPPGRKHKLWNTGVETLRLLCCCAPAYEHNDTVVTET